MFRSTEPITLGEMNVQNCGDVEALAEEIAVLVAQRQELRASKAQEAMLERNRLHIAKLQWELSRALIARYLPPDVKQAA